MKYRKITMAAAALGMLLLILDSGQAVASASEGIRLCMEVVIPSLLPFFLLSGILIRTVHDSPALSPLEALMQVPPGAGCYVLTGLLGGYPVGAQAVAEGFRQGKLTKAQANRLLSFCSQAGPSFLFGMAAAQFPHRGYGWALWAVQLISAWAVALLMPRAGMEAAKPREAEPFSFSQAMSSALKAMASVCGWVILFRVILGFFQRWVLWMLPGTLETLVCGILELSNGCLSLARVDDVGLRFLLAAVMLNFGGFCVGLQTCGAASGLDMGWYWRGKLLQGAMALALSAAAFGYPAGLLPMLALFTWRLLRKSGKRAGIRAQVGV